MHLHLEHTQSVHPSDEAREGRLSGAARSDEEEVALRLAVDTVDAEDVVEDFVEEDEWHVELFLVKHFQSRFSVLAQRFLFDRHVVLGQPVAIEDGTLERAIAIDVGKVLQSDTVDVFTRPQPLLVRHQS